MITGFFQFLGQHTTAPIHALTYGDDEAFPCVVVTLISSIADYSCDGATGYVKARLQVDVFAPRYADAVALNESLRSMLDSYTGTFPDGTFVANITRDNTTDQFEPAGRLYRIQSDWFVTYDQQ